MKRNGAIIVSAIILSLALIYSGKNISKAINFSSNINSAASYSDSLLMKEADAAKYLGVDEATFKKILAQDSREKQNVNVYPTYRFIPYIVIEGYKYFNKGELAKWVEFNMHNY